MATMKACRLDVSEKSFKVSDIPAPTNPKLGHVIVKVVYAGTCGSDLHIMEGMVPARDGVVLGHEVTGTIHKVGDGVRALQTGDMVAINPCSGCDGCRFCHRGTPNMCALSGVFNILGFTRDGGWAEYCEVPSFDAVPLPESLSLKQGVLSEPMSCVLNAWNKMGHIPDDAKILVMGAGIAGLMFASLFHYRGYRDITITSRTENRRTMAAKIGLGLKIFSLDEVGNMHSDVEKQAFQGFDVIVEATGSVVAFERAFAWLRRCGKMIVYGAPAPDEVLKIPAIDIVMKEIQIIGVACACNSFADAVAVVNNMSKAKYLDFDQLSVEMFKFDQVKEAIDSMHNNRINKAVFKLPDV